MLLWFNLSLGIQDVHIKGYELPPYYAQIELHAENDWLDIYTIYRNEMNKADSFMFSPLIDYFTVGASMTFGQFSFYIEHQCIHPVISGYQFGDIYGGGNKIGVTITSKPNK